MINSMLLKKLKVITKEEQKILDGDCFIDNSIYMDNANGIINSKKMLGKGKMITVRPHTRFVHFPLHCHDYVEVIYMCSGKTTHIIDGEKIELNEGELLFLNQGARQEILPAGKDDIAVNFIILPEFFANTLEMIEESETELFKFIVDCLADSRKGASFLHFKVSEILPVQNLIENLICDLTEDIKNSNAIKDIFIDKKCPLFLWLFVIQYIKSMFWREI